MYEWGRPYLHNQIDNKSVERTMNWLDFTYKCPFQNLALDEALLDLCESGCEEEILRFWEPVDYFVVLGASRKVHEEVHLSRCSEAQISVTRRSSGGGTVLLGPGCLNYSLILRIQDEGPTRSVKSTNEYVLRCHQSILQTLLDSDVACEGISDITWHGRKCSGNAQRRKKNYLLYHGTFLLHLDFAKVTQCLPIPQDQPSYRNQRDHFSFLTNLGLTAEVIKESLIDLWDGNCLLSNIPHSEVERLVNEKYRDEKWILRR